MQHQVIAVQAKAYILDRFARMKSNYTSWIGDCPIPCEVVEEHVLDWRVPADAGIIITHMHYRWEEVSAIRKIVETTSIPVLILCDGVLEFRNTWENPGIADGSIYQPIIGHKLACMGRGQARVVESWGNVGKCEIVGMPRFDQMMEQEFLPTQEHGPFRLLIATASTPAFTDEQRQQVIAGLSDLRTRVESNPWVEPHPGRPRPIEVQWRLTDGLEKEIGLAVEAESRELRTPLEEVVEQVDAVITTPSTLFFESVIKRRPTAILDYGNNPQYSDAAWNITAPIHVQPTIQSLANPPATRMQFQRAALHDHLECATPSKPRLFALIKAMVEQGIKAKQNKTPLTLPTRILSDPQRGIQVVESEFDRSILYPDNEIFQLDDVLRLQTELAHAIKRLDQLPRELDRKERHIAKMEVYLQQALERVEDSRLREQEKMKLVKAKQEDLARKDAHIVSLGEHLKGSLERIENFKTKIAWLEEQLQTQQLQTQQAPTEPVSKAA